MDVEGAEERLLRGAAKLLQDHEVALVIELHGVDATIAVLKFLWGIRYHVFGFLQIGYDRQYKEITPSDIATTTAQYSFYFCIAGRNVEAMMDPPMYRP
jgi:hypothetical protein